MTHLNKCRKMCDEIQPPPPAPSPSPLPPSLPLLLPPPLLWRGEHRLPVGLRASPWLLSPSVPRVTLCVKCTVLNLKVLFPGVEFKFPVVPNVQLANSGGCKFQLYTGLSFMLYFPRFKIFLKQIFLYIQ